MRFTKDMLAKTLENPTRNAYIQRHIIFNQDIAAGKISRNTEFLCH